MNSSKQDINNEASIKKLVLWPGVLLVFLQWVIRFVLPNLFSSLTNIGVMGGLFFGLLIFIWWGFFSKAPKTERWGAIVIILATLFAVSQIIHESISTAMQGIMFMVYSIPVLCLAFIGWAIITRHIQGKIRMISMILTIIISIAFWSVLRTDGMTGEAKNNFAWRWAETAEEKLLSSQEELSSLDPIGISGLENLPEWPGFRGSNRDGIINDIQIETDWNDSPPDELWRHPIGPGCSSFAVWGDLIFTQEQRGEYEIVSSYNLNSGEAVWKHQDSARFWDSHAGAGPRATPTVNNGKVFTMGATGILNVLDAIDGSVLWSRNAATDTNTELPGWGFTGSPLVVDDILIVAVQGSLAAYEINSGDILWKVSGESGSYSSPHLVELNGISQVMLLNGTGAHSYLPETGELLWSTPFSGEPISQPAITKEGDLFLSDGGYEQNLYRVSATLVSGKWSTEEKWASNRLKPYFYDFIIHKGNAYGFFGPNITSIEIENGSRNWKGSRCAGFSILLEDQDLLLTLTEKGEVVLTKAIPERFEELCRFQAIKGKTWNHPVLVGDKLLVRNSVEMAAFSIPSKRI